MSVALMKTLEIQSKALARQLAEATAKVTSLTDENSSVRALLTDFDRRHDADQAEVELLRVQIQALEAASATNLAFIAEQDAENTALKAEVERLRAKLDRRGKWLDSLKLRAESAEARERALLDSYEANRQQMMRNNTENAALKAEVERLLGILKDAAKYPGGIGDFARDALRAHEQGGA